MLYRGKISFVDERNQWVAVVVNRLTRKAVTLGCFTYRGEAKRWVQDCIKRKAWRDCSELPDVYG
jgi:hypothetical protein